MPDLLAPVSSVLSKTSSVSDSGGLVGRSDSGQD